MTSSASAKRSGPGGGIDAVVADLVGRDAAADAELEPAAAHLVEHADLVDQAQRMIEVHGVDQRPEAQRLGALRHGGQEDAGRGRHAERRRVMLGQVIGVEARALVELDQAQPLVELPAEIGAGAVHVVEDAELHPFPPFSPMLQGLHEEVSVPSGPRASLG